ncbi:hypothetical protein Trydic_g9695 [Trypoxylus dichotomus]
MSTFVSTLQTVQHFQLLAGKISSMQPIVNPVGNTITKVLICHTTRICGLFRQKLTQIPSNVKNVIVLMRYYVVAIILLFQSFLTASTPIPTESTSTDELGQPRFVQAVVVIPCSKGYLKIHGVCVPSWPLSD